MRTKNLLKLALTMVAMFVMTGAMAQQTITILKNDLTAADGAQIFLIDANGFETTTQVGANADVNGEITTTFTVGNNLAVKLLTERTTFVVPATPADLNGQTFILYPAAGPNNYVQAYEPTYQTVSTPFRLYVAPDRVYSPSWDPSDNDNTLNTASRWTWALTAGTTAMTAVTDITNPIAQNWAQFNAGATAGAGSISVQEGFGACVSDFTQAHIVNVVAAPTGAILRGVDASATAANFQVGTTLREYAKCSAADADVDLEVVVTEVVPEALASYSYRVVYKKYAIDANGDPVAALPADVEVVNHPLTSKKAATTYSDGNNTVLLESAIATTAILDYVAANTRTQIDFTITKVDDTDVAGSGMVSQVSHKSDYIAILAAGGTPVQSYAFGAAADLTVSFIINPKPITGPIYHVPNSWNTL